MRRGIEFKKKARIIVIDDNYDHLTGIKELIELESDFDVVAVASSANVGISLVKKYRPESRIMLTAIPLTAKRIIEVQFLKTAFNETVINLDLSAEDVETVKPYKIPAHIFATESDYDDYAG